MATDRNERTTTNEDDARKNRGPADTPIDPTTDSNPDDRAVSQTQSNPDDRSL